MNNNFGTKNLKKEWIYTSRGTNYSWHNRCRSSNDNPYPHAKIPRKTGSKSTPSDTIHYD